MDLRDGFVGTVAIVLGAMMLYTAILNEGWCFQMKLSRVIAESKGRREARTVIGAVGSFVILMGLYILLAPLLAATFLQSSEIRSLPNDSEVGEIHFAEAE